MANINIGKAPGNSVVLPFYSTGAIAFLILTIIMLLHADAFTGHYFSPHMLTIVHLAALGWGTMVIFGAAHQLLPVICERNIYSEELAGICWYLLTIGVAALTWSFWDFRIGWIMISGGVFILLASLLFLINVMLTTRICIHYSIQKLFILTSATWLVITASIGLLLAINLADPFFTSDHMHILKLHAHAGLTGWFLMLITGVSTRLIPMFLLSKSEKVNLLHYAYILQNAGLVFFLLDGYFTGMKNRWPIYLIIVTSGIVCWILYLYDNYKKRVRKKIELLMKQTISSFIFIILALATLPLILMYSSVQLTLLYGVLLFMGWISGIILGKTFKTLPFIVWNTHYKTLSGKAKIPLPKQLYNDRLIPWQFRFFIAGMVLFCSGIMLQQVMVIRIGAASFLLTAILYTFNVLKIIMHKTKTID